MSSEALKALAKALLARGAAWLRTRALPRVLGFLAEAWQQLTAHRVRNLLVLALLAAAALGAARLVPVVYGRAALAHAAGDAARQSRIKGEDRVVWELRHRAFELGLTEGALEPDVFRLETGWNDDGPTCTVSYDFVHTVPVYGAWRVPVRVRGKVTRIQVEPTPNALDEEKRVQ